MDLSFGTREAQVMFDHIREFHQPATAKEAIRLLGCRNGEACLVAGGTDLALRAGRSISVLVDISRLGLSYVRRKGKSLHIGATTTMAGLEESVLVQLLANGILARAAASCGSPQTRNMATLGGNLANASPAADTAIPLLVLDAEVVLQGLRSQRTLPLDRFFIAPHATNAKHELLTEIVVHNAKPHTAYSFQRFGRTETDIAAVNLAAAIQLNRDGRCSHARLALGAVAPTPMRAQKAETALEGKVLTTGLIKIAADIAADEISPVSDIRASADYRREIGRVLARRALEECMQRLEGEQRAGNDVTFEGGSR
jgi:CO/xanthine dehydrogenase FAD-binding subunit